MFPIQENSLPIGKIAEFWAREIVPKATSTELKNAIEVAWWRGEIASTTAGARLGLLRGLIRTCPKDLVFTIENQEGRPLVQHLNDGGALVDIRPRIPLPSSDEACWVDQDCVQSFKVIADQWINVRAIPNFALVAPALRSIEISRKEFQRWIETRKCTRPLFWGTLSKTEMQSGALEAAVPTDDEVRALIREAIAQHGGFISQEKGAEIVRRRWPGFNKKHAMALVKGLTQNKKPGPKGPRKKSAQ